GPSRFSSSFEGIEAARKGIEQKEPGMAEERVELKDINYRQVLPWTELFRGFQVALDPKKLLLAAGGILAMSLGWYVLAWVFFNSHTEPTWGDGKEGKYGSWAGFQQERQQWNLLYKAAGPLPSVYAPDDLADGPDEYEQIRQKFDKIPDAVRADIAAGRRSPVEFVIQGKNEDGETVDKTIHVAAKPHGKM